MKKLVNNIKKYFKILTFTLFILSLLKFLSINYIIISQKNFESDSIGTYIVNTGIFNIDKSNGYSSGFSWPINSNIFAVSTSGLCCGAYIRDTLKEFMCSYGGELVPGYIIDSVGFPKAKTDVRFKLYKIKKGDNAINNADWLNWGAMVPFGAPYTDVNHNNFFDPFIDTPGVKNSSQTIFACLTDGFPEEHKLGEGFGGGTPPLYAEIRLTAWVYNNEAMQNIQYLKWQIVNKNKYSWDSTYFSLYCDPDLGNYYDDYIGCDTIRELGFCYNADNDDEHSFGGNYGINPPAVGFRFIRSAINKNINPQFQLGLTSFTYVGRTSSWGPACENDANGEIEPAYFLMTGVKKDRTPWVVPLGGPGKMTKFCYSGNPESGQGWNEGVPGNPSGRVLNCGGPNVLTGTVEQTSRYGDRRIIMSSGSRNLKINPKDTQTIVIAQLIARGTSNLNSVTKLKQLSDIAQTFYDSGYVIGLNNISSDIPQMYKLYQNYPNPFNPSTNIKFSLPNPSEGGAQVVKIIIFDITGRAVATLIDKEMKAGSYSADWNASNYSSGIYFYSLLIDNKIFETRKMVLIK
jgi:hypothetical protein